MQTFTVSEIAERIREPGEDLAVVADRLRNLTRERLLRPIGKRNPGIGHTRRYPESALIEAAILSKLWLLFGMPPSRVSGFDLVLTLAAKWAPQTDELSRNGTVACLVIGYTYLFGAAATPIPGNRVVLAPRTELRNDMDPSVSDIALRLPETTECCVVINLTALVKRIGLSRGESSNGEHP